MMVPTVPCHYLVQSGLITQPWNLHGPWSTQQVTAVKVMYSYWLQVALNVASNRKLKEIMTQVTLILASLRTSLKSTLILPISQTQSQTWKIMVPIQTFNPSKTWIHRSPNCDDERKYLDKLTERWLVDRGIMIPSIVSNTDSDVPICKHRLAALEIHFSDKQFCSKPEYWKSNKIVTLIECLRVCMYTYNTIICTRESVIIVLLLPIYELPIECSPL